MNFVNKILIVLFCGMLAPVIYAQDAGSGYVGMVSGLSVPDADNTNVHTLSGILGGSRFGGQIGVGGYYFVSSIGDGPNNANFSFNLTGLEGRVNLVAGEKEVYVAMRAGITKIKTTIAASPVVYSPYHWGFVSGYSYKLYSRFSIGIEGSYLAVNGDETTVSATTSKFSPFHIISFLAVLGFSF